jgi:hypothetical protein
MKRVSRSLELQNSCALATINQRMCNKYQNASTVITIERIYLL